MSSKVLVVLPTFNEYDNLPLVIPPILSALPEAQLWIVDDNSPDGTGTIADDLAAGEPRLTVFHRPRKSGLGTAYAESFARALDEGFDFVIQMDSDFSHDPAVLPVLLEAAAQADLVVGSRYVPGGSTPDWTLPRRLISRTGNLVARTVLGLPVEDATAGYRVFSRRALSHLRLAEIRLQGYGFQIETAYQCHRLGLKILEVPICFKDRSRGYSKMSTAIVLEALFYVFRRRIAELKGGLSAVDQPKGIGRHDHPPSKAEPTDQNVQPEAPARVDASVDALE